jgi:hypothetical protein
VAASPLVAFEAFRQATSSYALGAMALVALGALTVIAPIVLWRGDR